MKVLTIIPVYNENGHIIPLIKVIKKFCRYILVINDGSTDNTLSELQKIGDIFLQSNEKNLGKGNSIRRGFKYALEQKYDAVILMDGDGQHDPAEINNFIKKIKFSDIVVGNRMDNCKNMPIIRYLVNRLDSIIVSKLINYHVKDVHCGYRALTTNLIRKLSLKSERYEIEVEMIIEARRNRATISNLNIGCIYSGQKSSINPITDSYRFIKLILSRN